MCFRKSCRAAIIPIVKICPAKQDACLGRDRTLRIYVEHGTLAAYTAQIFVVLAFFRWRSCPIHTNIELTLIENERFKTAHARTLENDLLLWQFISGVDIEADLLLLLQRLSYSL